MPEVIHHGQQLTQAHLDILTPILNEGLGHKQFIKKVDAAFLEAGIPVKPLEPKDKVLWNFGNQIDHGQIVEIYKRNDQARCRSHTGRCHTIPMRHLRLIEEE